MRKASVFSRLFGVVFALYVLPIPASAGVGPDLKQNGPAQGFAIGSDMSWATVPGGAPGGFWPAEDLSGNRLEQSGSVGTLPLGASGFTLAPVGSSGDVRWALFSSSDGETGPWVLPVEATEIPEPAPLAILGLAILGLGFYRAYRSA